jgi:peptidoglycan/xylan/chitin deacetylase (PgdA/CDA1 family)
VTAKLRRLMVVVVAGILYYLGAWRLLYRLRRWASRKTGVCILCLHRVLSDNERAHSDSPGSMVLREGTFEVLLQYLRREFRIISLEELEESGGKRPDRAKPLCLITFDDGWRDNYTTAYPCLKKYGIPATIFVTTGMLETPEGFWVEHLVRAWRDPGGRQQIQSRFRREVPGGRDVPDLEEIIETCKRMPAEKRRPFVEELAALVEARDVQYTADQMLTWQQIMEMSAAGIDFGSHTVSHPLLTYEDDATVERELSVSKRDLGAKLAKRVSAFAYPNGDWDERIRRMVKEAGYEYAFTIQRGWHFWGKDRHAIPRFVLHEGNVTGFDGRFSPAVLVLRLSGWH